MLAVLEVEDDATGITYTVYELELTTNHNSGWFLCLFDGANPPADNADFTVNTYTAETAAVDFQIGGGDSTFVSDAESINSGNDVGASDDTVYGYDGADNLQAEAGNDTIFGGEGDDNIRGDNNHDSI